VTSETIVAGVRQFLLAHPPYSLMTADDVDFVARRLDLAYHSRGEVVIDPHAGPPVACFIVKQGVVDSLVAGDGERGGEAPTLRHLTPGESFPLGALLAERPVTKVYRAATDAFVWRLDKAAFEELTRRSPVFLDFCRRRLGALLDLSEHALQANYAAQTAQRRSMEATLESVIRRAPFTCAPDEPLDEVFRRMERERVGSVIVVDPQRPDGPVAGIFTRQDVIGRVVLAGVPLDTPISRVMTSPVISLDAAASVADAMLLMAERSIRHVPVTRGTQLAGIVTERDLFVMQRRSLRQIGDAIRAAGATAELAVAASDIREWSHSLVAQGVSASFVTRLISRLNDQLTARMVALVAERHGVDVGTVCWLALGSEGREEQTIATDQDNGLIVGPDCTSDRERLLAFAREVNEGLDACGYPLCKGGIMASNPRWCLDLDGWRAVFDDWIGRGDPQSLLNASVFFDFRALTGAGALAVELRRHVTARAKGNPRFLKQMSDNALRNSPPPSWTGGFLDQLLHAEAREVDLKMNGTVPFVDGARLLSLARGIEATGTAERFEALAEAGAIPPSEARSWIDAFQFLQSLRLRVQHGRAAGDGNPNLLDTSDLSRIDRRILKEAFAQARHLQQRLALDYPG